MNTAPDAGNASHVTGLCCNANGPQAYVSSEAAHTGTHSLIDAGRGTGASPTQAYTKILDISHSNLVLDCLSVLSYWVYPQSQAAFGAVSGSLSGNVALDIIFSDGAALRGSGLVDTYGNGVTPALQSPGLVLDAWN